MTRSYLGYVSSQTTDTVPVMSYGVATGGTSSSITVSGQAYTLLTFTGDGTLTVTKAGLFDVMVVGGGGSGGNKGVAGVSGGGGGGGGIAIQTVYLSANATVTVGGGGALFANGSTSRLGTFPDAVAGIGGARGVGQRNTGSGEAHPYYAAGGCGSGAAGGYSGGVAYQGFAGGAGGGTNAGGGGGGGSAVGGDAATSTSGGNGGAGYDASTFRGESANTTRYAGGGGGAGTGASGSGGSGGGGAGSNSTATNGSTNTGGGGGAGDAAGSGGSGIVLVRFKV